MLKRGKSYKYRGLELSFGKKGEYSTTIPNQVINGKLIQEHKVSSLTVEKLISIVDTEY